MHPSSKIDRRQFIRIGALATGGLLLACNTGSVGHTDAADQPLPEGPAAFSPNLFVHLHTDGTLVLVASRSEMGNGVRTSLPSVLADEMGADWARVRIEQAPGDARYGDQNTDGSRSVRYLFEPMRQMGATARMLLIAAAAKQWGVAAEECTAENHTVRHTGGREASFGDLAALAAQQPVPKTLVYKNPQQYRYIGHKLPSVDARHYANGKAQFGMDLRLPDMRFAAVARCPVVGGSLKSFDATEALKIPGVEAVHEIPRIDRPFGTLAGVAVVATNTWAAFRAKAALKIEWELGPNAHYHSDSYRQQLAENISKPDQVVHQVGSVDKAFAVAAKVVESTFHLPHLAHAPMEVPNATAWFEADQCIVWAPTQDPQTAREEVVHYLQTTEDKVTIRVSLLGGGFGRKSKPDYIVEAVHLARKMQKPVQVVWTREDDLRHGYYHTTSAQYLKAALDAQGRVTGWLHRFAMPSIESTFRPGAEYPASWEASSATQVPFEIENQRFETAKAPAHVRIGWMRSVINIPHGFAINVFADELAHAAGQDPLAHRLQLIGSDRIQDTQNPIKYDTARLKNVLQLAARKAQWGTPPPEGRARGLAVQYSFYSYVASVVEISLEAGKLRVHKVFTAIDCGLVVNRDTVIAQLEGSAIFGMSIALYGKITARDGAIEQQNYTDYRMVRLPQSPEIQVEIVDSPHPPMGVGEPGVPVVAPAIVNALFALTGKRYYHLPLADEGLV